MIERSSFLLLGGVLLVALAAPADAVTRFRAMLTHEQEVSNPPVPDEGAGGIGLFELNDDMTALSYDVRLFGLDLGGFTADPNDDVTRAHIHAAPAGTNGGVVFGQISPNHDLDDLVIDAAAGRISGVWDGAEGNGTTLAAQLQNLLDGNLYFNVHTFDHAGGEVRGQILLVPEPSTVVLSMLALASVVWWKRH